MGALLKEEYLPTVATELAQSLQKLGIDPNFVVAPEHRPQRKQNFGEEEQIPVIDLEALFTDPRNQVDREKITEQVRDASEKWGFFQVVNHGIPLELLNEVQSVAKEFFASPIEEKRKIRRSSVNPLGYYDSELTKNTRDWKEVFDFIPDVPPEFDQVFNNQWPEDREQFQEVCQKWAQAVQRLGYKILEILACSLGLSPNHFNEFFINNTSLMRLNYYAKCPVPDLILGVSRHKDQGALTVLVQDEVGGLEVKRKSDGEWVRVTPRPDAFVINVGDMMQVWSNDRYHSVEHRVVLNDNRDRFSFPFFMFPSYQSTIVPVASLTSPDNPPKYRAFNYGEFDKNRKNSNFKPLGVENLQISHYTIDDKTDV